MSRRSNTVRDAFSFIKPYKLPKGIMFIPADREHFCMTELNNWLNVRLKNCFRIIGLMKIPRNEQDESTQQMFLHAVLELRLLEEYYKQLYMYYITGNRDIDKMDRIRHLCNNISELFDEDGEDVIDMFLSEDEYDSSDDNSSENVESGDIELEDDGCEHKTYNTSEDRYQKTGIDGWYKNNDDHYDDETDSEGF